MDWYRSPIPRHRACRRYRNQDGACRAINSRQWVHQRVMSFHWRSAPLSSQMILLHLLHNSRHNHGMANWRLLMATRQSPIGWQAALVIPDRDMGPIENRADLQTAPVE